jgi:hypothetical protein
MNITIESDDNRLTEINENEVEKENQDILEKFMNDVCTANSKMIAATIDIDS